MRSTQPVSAEAACRQVSEQVEAVGEKPVRKGVMGELDVRIEPSPDTRVARRVGVDGDNARRRVAAEQLMQLVRSRCTRLGHPGGAHHARSVAIDRACRYLPANMVAVPDT